MTVNRFAKRGWIAVSKDRGILRSELFVRTIVENGAQFFVCVGTYSHREYAENIVRSRHKLAKWASRRGKGFIARLYMAPPLKGDHGKRTSGEIKAFDHTSFLSRFP